MLEREAAYSIIRGFKIFSSLNYKEKHYGSWVCAFTHTDGKLQQGKEYRVWKTSKENQKIDNKINDYQKSVHNKKRDTLCFI